MCHLLRKLSTQIRVEPEAAIEMPREAAIEPEATFEDVIVDDSHGEGMDMGMVSGTSSAERTREDRPVERICDRAGRDSKGSNAGRVATVYSADAEPLAGDEWPGVRICDRTGQDSKVMRSGSGRLPRILVEPMPDERCPQQISIGSARDSEPYEQHAKMSMEVEDIDGEIAAIIRSVGGNVASYKRDRSRALNRLVSEIYSPPRVAAAAKLLPSLGCLPGFSLDLTTCDENGHPWDFDVPA